MPLASVVEDEYQVLNKEGDHIRDVKKSINEQIRIFWLKSINSQ